MAAIAGSVGGRLSRSETDQPPTANSQGLATKKEAAEAASFRNFV